MANKIESLKKQTDGKKKLENQFDTS